MSSSNQRGCSRCKSGTLGQNAPNAGAITRRDGSERRALSTNGELQELLSKCKPLTAEEVWEQRISFAYGNVSIESPNITKEMVREIAEQVYGRTTHGATIREEES